jgi:hypothetical protein
MDRHLVYGIFSTSQEGHHLQLEPMLSHVLFVKFFYDLDKIWPLRSKGIYFLYHPILAHVLFIKFFYDLDKIWPLHSKGIYFIYQKYWGGQFSIIETNSMSQEPSPTHNTSWHRTTSHNTMYKSNPSHMEKEPTGEIHSALCIKLHCNCWHI